MTFPSVSCVKCGFAYPRVKNPYCCPECGGLFDFHKTLRCDLRQVDRSQPGIWRYQSTFDILEPIAPVSLGEGNTPLIQVDIMGRHVAFKCEYINPSGSFKDRGSALIAAWLCSRGVNEAVEDSSGNAGASFAAYAARAGIKARIFVPDSASGPKRRQIEAYGAELVPVAGSRADVTDAVRRVADSGLAYASHAYLPFNLPGYATAAYEIVAQLGQMPGSVIVPMGQGGFLLGLSRGFDALRAGNNSYSTPRMIGVQAEKCSPLWAMFKKDDKFRQNEKKETTLAEGVCVRNPLRSTAIITAIYASGGDVYIVGEDEIMSGREALAHLGFYVEPTSAIVMPVLSKILAELSDPIVVILTGSGLKYG